MCYEYIPVNQFSFIYHHDAINVMWFKKLPRWHCAVVQIIKIGYYLEIRWETEWNRRRNG
jgi:hypothetical protein